MSVDWSQFRDGDKIRVSFEGVWRTGGTYAYFATGGMNMHLRGSLYPAASAELIERPFTPPPAGTLFRSKVGVLYISHGEGGYRALVDKFGAMCDDTRYDWFEDTSVGWRDGIEVLDV